MTTALKYIPEPMLQFGRDQHPDIRYGIMNFGPHDLGQKRKPTEIKLGIVGAASDIASAVRWIERCRTEVQGQVSPKHNLFAPFPGFSKQGPFEADCVLDRCLNTEVQTSRIAELQKLPSFNERVSAAVDLFLSDLQTTAQKRPDVILCVMPLELLKLLGEEALESGEGNHPRRSKRRAHRGRFNFHDMLKAKALGLRVPIQLARPSTFDRALKSKEKDDFARRRQMQDEATCAWNMFVALYYKAGGCPWRLIRDPSDFRTCFIGISFYEVLDGSKLNASVAQVFDERGHGLLVQGGVVQKDAVDRQPRMDETASHALLRDALQSYWNEHKHFPARVVVHKSSSFNAAETEGALRAFKEKQISRFDLLSVSESWMRLVRNGYYPPLRGTYWEVDDLRSLLYTNGSVQLYEEYPGLWVPRSLLIQHGACQSDRLQLAAEVLTLTKMNWNNSQITALEPITVKAARQVGRIIKYLDAKQDAVPYWFFM